MTTGTVSPPAPVRPRAAGLRFRWVFVCAALLLVAVVAGVAIGPVSLPLPNVALSLMNHLPGVDLDTGLSDTQNAIVWKLRLPRVLLALLVGAMLAMAGGCYQGVFRNPLADPTLLGVSAGAGLGATVFIIARARGLAADPHLLPLASFIGGLAALAATYMLGTSGGKRRRGTVTLVLAGVAVSSFLTAIQTFVQQRNIDTIESVYSWLLGRISLADWDDVYLLLPYAAITLVVVLIRRRELDVLSVGDDEATALGLHPQSVRFILLSVASLATAAAVSVSGLIGFVGIVVPHIVRLLAGRSYRSILPLSMLVGAIFLIVADLAARTVVAPAELPIGVVTAFVGAPFFILVMRTSNEATP